MKKSGLPIELPINKQPTMLDIIGMLVALCAVAWMVCTCEATLASNQRVETVKVGNALIIGDRVHIDE